MGIGAAAAPLLPLLNANAQNAPRPKRLILVFTPDGAPAQNFNTTVDWRPTGTETAFNFHAIHAPLNALKAKITVPWGLTMTAGGAGEPHAFGMAGLWTGSTLPGPSGGVSFDGGNGNRTGWGIGPSLDQIVAQAYGPNMPYQQPAAMGETKYRSIALGIQCGSPNTLNRMTYTGPAAPITPEMNPVNAFNYFMGVTPGGGGPVTPVPDPAAMRRFNEQKALVAALAGDLQRMRGRVGKDDYEKVDAHLGQIQAMGQRLTPPTTTTTATPPSAGCVIPARPAAGQSNNAAFPTQIRQMMDLAVGLLACDVTRVLTLQISYAFSHVLHTWLNHTSDHHNMSHDGSDRRVQLQQIDTWYAEQMAYFLGKLDAVNEGTGTLLDNCLVVWGRELGSTAHRMDRVPFILAGGAGGALRTGRNLNFQGQEHSKLLVSVAQIMGLTQVTAVGDRNMSGAKAGPLAL
jgi:hypothetical protein